MPGRQCGPCNLCCKVVAVESLAKPADQWCKHAKKGAGCVIYGQHPHDCKGFKCGWLESEDLTDSWRPDRCKFVLRSELEGRRLCVDVDTGYPNAWRKEPFYTHIKEWSRAAWANEGHVLVYIGLRAIAVFPEEELATGNFLPGEDLVVGYRHYPTARQPVVRLTRADGSVHEVLGKVYSNI